MRSLAPPFDHAGMMHPPTILVHPQACGFARGGERPLPQRNTGHKPKEWIHATQDAREVFTGP